MSKKKVVSLFTNGDDPRIDALYNEVREVIYRRAEGTFTLASVIGVLELIKHELIEDAQ